PETTNTYISKGIIVFETKENVFIFDFKKEIIRIIDHDEKSYAEGTIDEYISFIEGMHSRMMKKMEEIPPEQRKMMEEMMKMMQPKINIKKLDRSEKILGYNTEVYEVEVETGGMYPVKMKSQNYISPDLKFVPSEISKEDAEKISKKFEKIKDKYGFSNIIGKIEEGFTLKSISYDEKGEEIYRTQAISINKGEIPPSLIQIPKGYEKEELKDIFMEE
ncbi:MAG: hypothetical protein ABIM82_05035, partial [candidate division WOR-3 bacterium]